MKAAAKVIVSPAEYRASRNLAAGRESGHGLQGRAVMGGHKSTLMTLRRAGLITLRGQLTEAGRKVIAGAKQRQ
jgi:hypothetical protein